MVAAFAKPIKGWTSGGEQSLAAFEALGGAAVPREVTEDLELHIQAMATAWRTGASGGRGRKAEAEDVDAAEEDQEEKKPKARKIKAEPQLSESQPTQLHTLVHDGVRKPCPCTFHDWERSLSLGLAIRAWTQSVNGSER